MRHIDHGWGLWLPQAASGWLLPSAKGMPFGEDSPHHVDQAGILGTQGKGCCLQVVEDAVAAAVLLAEEMV